MLLICGVLSIASPEQVQPESQAQVVVLPIDDVMRGL